jgi:hypothetical protein
MEERLGLLKRTSLTATALLAAFALSFASQALAQTTGKPNILVIFGDDVGLTDISIYSLGLMGIRTPNIDRIAKEGLVFTDYYAEQSCTAGRSTFITGQVVLRTGMSKVGLPGAKLGLQKEDMTMAEALKHRGGVARTVHLLAGTALVQPADGSLRNRGLGFEHLRRLGAQTFIRRGAGAGRRSAVPVDIQGLSAEAKAVELQRRPDHRKVLERDDAQGAVSGTATATTGREAVLLPW